MGKSVELAPSEPEEDLEEEQGKKCYFIWFLSHQLRGYYIFEVFSDKFTSLWCFTAKYIFCKCSVANFA